MTPAGEGSEERFFAPLRMTGECAMPIQQSAIRENGVPRERHRAGPSAPLRINGTPFDCAQDKPALQRRRERRKADPSLETGAG